MQDGSILSLQALILFEHKVDPAVSIPLKNPAQDPLKLSRQEVIGITVSNI